MPPIRSHVHHSPSSSQTSEDNPSPGPLEELLAPPTNPHMAIISQKTTGLPVLGPTLHTGQKRALLGWNHKKDTPEGLMNGRLWCWVGKPRRGFGAGGGGFQVFDEPFNRSPFPVGTGKGPNANGNVDIDCGVANFGMVRMFHPWWCPYSRVPKDKNSSDKRMCRHRYAQLIARRNADRRTNQEQIDRSIRERVAYIEGTISPAGGCGTRAAAAGGSDRDGGRGWNGVVIDLIEEDEEEGGTGAGSFVAGGRNKGRKRTGRERGRARGGGAGRRRVGGLTEGGRGAEAGLGTGGGTAGTVEEPLELESDEETLLPAHASLGRSANTAGDAEEQQMVMEGYNELRPDELKVDNDELMRGGTRRTVVRLGSAEDSHSDSLFVS